MSTTRAPGLLVAIARGNHVEGYVGVLVEGWQLPGEHEVGRCGHRHALTNEARNCARDHATRLGWTVERPRG